jgi:putative hydrolase of the HAD superfamily
MTNQIEAILFDMGGTLRSTTIRLPEVDKEKIHEMVVLLGMDIDEAEFIELLQKHARAYRDWAKKTRLELNEVELWTRWMLPDCPFDQISRLALQLSQLWRDATGRHVVFPETQETVLALFRRGYRLGLVSNTTSSVETPRVLQELGIAGCFDTVILSCEVGIRKPDPSILLMAAERMGIRPEYCAYIGDQPHRDVAAAREAGFGTVILRDPKSPPDLPQEVAPIPEHTIYNLTELLDIFPHRSAPQPATVYDASLSTMWAMKNFPTLTDFFEAARRMGFARIELNHKVTTPMLAGIDLSHYQFSSVHEPCPADIGEDELKKRDWLISSTDEACRIEGVNAIKRSIDIANRIGIPAIVIHSGQSTPDKDKLEKKLRAWIDEGKRDSDEYRTVQAQMINIRAEHATASFESLKKSMLDLLAHAEPLGVRLGIENRYHYLEHPSPDELQILLDLASPKQIGFIYDIGHAETLDCLGFYLRGEWLERFAPRIIGTHLHDVINTTDHYAAGLGKIDFETLYRYLPTDAFRTCEFQSSNSPEQVKAGLEFLAEHGCIKKF